MAGIPLLDIQATTPNQAGEESRPREMAASKSASA